MSDNRDYLDERALVKREQILDKGLPIGFLAGKYQVSEGYCAVLTEGGVYKETLGPGFYYLNKYKLFRDLRATVVNLRIQSLSIETERKYRIKDPPIQVDMNLTVEYKVSNPRIVALEYEEPVKALFDRVHEVIDPIISFSTYDEVMTNRNEIGRKIFQGLQSSQIANTLGIEIHNVIIGELKALDAKGDATAERRLAMIARMEDAQLEAYLLANTPMDIRTMLIQASPDQRIELLKDLAARGLLSPEGMALFAPAGSTQNNSFLGMLGSGNFGGYPGQYPNQNYGGYPGQNPNQNFGGYPGQYPNQNFGGYPGQQLPNPYNPPQITGTSNTGAGGSQNRMVLEINYLNNLPGASVHSALGKDKNTGLPAGNTLISVTLPSNSGGTIACYFNCSSQYPMVPPNMYIEVDGMETPFESSIMRSWQQNYLLEIVQEIQARV
ncbi:MAG: hypothetical protein KBA03_00270 [Anaerolineaceae bacterium]|nr:hypothetical protein [Anaerolineaceae bacterium]